MCRKRRSTARFDTLSGGEQTRVMLSALFAREDAYPLIDEPTNSLDAPGRAMLADYLRRKDGFLLVSHDRAFLNRLRWTTSSASTRPDTSRHAGRLPDTLKEERA